ncbi:MAG: hypothetical protein CMC19_09430 [Flavobacteriaceae bacterium]|nr:hypothetical protein [Flavobacteriaceae bacterium]
MLARDNNKKRQRGQPLEANTSLCEQAPKICSVEARLADNVDADAWAKAFVSASTIASMLVPRTFFLVEATNLWHTARFFWNRVSCLFKFSNPDTCLHHPVQTSIVIGRTRGVIVTVLINKRDICFHFSDVVKNTQSMIAAIIKLRHSQICDQ